MSHPLFDISGRTALVTGSSRGIGLALARGLAEAGCTVVLNGRDAPRLERAAAGLPGTVHTSAFDVTDGPAVRAGLADVENRVGPLDILVNNAGMQLRAPLLEFADSDWHRVLDANVTSAFLVGREAARGMTARGHGKIVNICSLQSEVARPGIAPYAAAKGALKMLTKGMCADWGPHGVQVNGLGPGYIETELTRPLVEDEEFSAWVRRRTPAGRWGRTEDLVGGVLFLVSPAADFVGGQVLYVDGGMTSVL
ncbi:SDR family oxidoreductase [Streptomyces sp. ID05-04B]|uniref:SDR family oxidoreductase n=1 Tax=unclassified Streptomyces TaxID=2593676 RepID=UPI000D19C3B4|nr:MULTISPECIES: SDR family oxidoreductase [unclassified Streptomyces]AVV43536.1 gluconate 5-dehydrogenase [Streptomyces sp. P3]MDX5570680.1 SDR family oxidoreductase [Streptomyces sp. ID05-04B]